MVTRDPLHGWGLAALQSLAAAVVARHRHWWPAGDITDQHGAAWDGIIGQLLSSEEPPSRQDLAAAGLRALSAHVRREISHQGGGSHNGIPNAGARFTAFWDWHARPAPDPQDGVTERLAIAQILPALTPRQQQALTALAACEDYQAAAAAMGISVGTFEVHIRRARAAFRVLWHEGEMPSRQWRKDKRVFSRSTGEEEIPECGTLRAAWRHRRRKEDCPGGQCAEVLREYKKRRAVLKATA